METFLNLGKPHPAQVFAAVIWGSDESKFGRPEVDCKEIHICVTGKIAECRVAPEIAAIGPRQTAKQ